MTSEERNFSSSATGVSAAPRAIVLGGAPSSLRTWFGALRPAQWIKNAFVLSPLLFSGKAFERGAELSEISAFVAFCLVASGVYLFNDVIDRASDAAHPVKRFRGVAA